MIIDKVVKNSTLTIEDRSLWSLVYSKANSMTKTPATSNAYSCAQDSQAEAETANPTVVDYHTLEHAVCNRHCCNHTQATRTTVYEDSCCHVYKTGETLDTCKVS